MTALGPPENRRSVTKPGAAFVKGVEDDETVSEDARPVIFVGIIILVLFFGLLGGWASLAPLEGATIANGQIKVEGSRKAVQHMDGGTVKAILVHEGEHVAADQVLVTLDDTVARTTAVALSQQYYALLAQEARLLAETRKDTTLTIPPELIQHQDEPTAGQAIQGQTEMFKARQAIADSQTEMLNQKVAELQQQSLGAEAQMQARVAQRKSVDNELAGLRPLYDQGIVAHTRLLDLERERQRLDGEVHQLSSTVAGIQQSIEQTRQQILHYQLDRAGQVASDLRDTQTRLAETRQRLTAAQDVLRRMEIRSPADGIVLGLSVFAKGTVIGRGERIMEIVPEPQTLVVEGQIRVEDISYVHQGMAAEIRLTGLRQRSIPIIRGTITYVAADRLTDPRTNLPFYLIEARINPEDLRHLPNQDISPGMPATVMIPTGKRTALDYLMEPIRDSFSKAFREH